MDLSLGLGLGLGLGLNLGLGLGLGLCLDLSLGLGLGFGLYLGLGLGLGLDLGFGLNLNLYLGVAIMRTHYLSRTHYWSCSKFADWIRGTEKGGAKTGREWSEWRAVAKRRPVRYWIAEEALDSVQGFLWWPIDLIYEVKYYVNNRWVTRSHCLTAHSRDIAPGEWRDVGYRFLPCLFNELVNFVEVELAMSHVAWDRENRSKYIVPWWAAGWWRLRFWRCPRAGIDNLEWQSSLVYGTNDGIKPEDPLFGQPTRQATSAREILALYRWWTEVHSKRPDAHDAGGWSAYCDMRRARGDDMLDLEDRNPEEAAMSREALDKTRAIEKAYEEEDEEMMIRLIRVRGDLWT